MESTESSSMLGTSSDLCRSNAFLSTFFPRPPAVFSQRTEKLGKKHIQVSDARCSWRLPHEFALCNSQFRFAHPDICYCGMCLTVFRGFAEPESGLARWYKFLARCSLCSACISLGGFFHMPQRIPSGKSVRNLVFQRT